MAHSNLVPACGTRSMRMAHLLFSVDHFQESKNIFKDFMMYFYHGLPYNTIKSSKTIWDAPFLKYLGVKIAF